MGTTLFADVSPLLDAAAASDESRVIAATLDLLATPNVTPTKIVGRAGLAAGREGLAGREGEDCGDVT